MAQTSLSWGYTCTIHPKSSGTNLPPAASQASRVEMEPAIPNLGFFFQASDSCPLGGKQKFTCSCHCATLSGIRASSSSSLTLAGAVYITPASLYPSGVLSYSNEVGCSGLKLKPASNPYQ